MDECLVDAVREDMVRLAVVCTVCMKAPHEATHVLTGSGGYLRLVHTILEREIGSLMVGNEGSYVGAFLHRDFSLERQVLNGHSVDGQAKQRSSEVGDGLLLSVEGSGIVGDAGPFLAGHVDVGCQHCVGCCHVLERSKGHKILGRANLIDAVHFSQCLNGAACQPHGGQAGQFKKVLFHLLKHFDG